MAVGILIEAEDTSTAGEDTRKKSTAVVRKFGEIVAILTGSSAHQGRSRSGGVFVRAVEAGCIQSGPQMDCKAMRPVRAAWNQQRSEVMGNTRSQCYSGV